MRRPRVLLVLLLALAGLGVGIQPASAESGYVPDAAEGEYPDLLRLFVDNGTETLTVKLKYAALPTGEFGGEEIHFGRGPDFAHYSVGVNWNYMTERWVLNFARVTAEGEFIQQSCAGVTRYRNYEQDTSRYTVPRSCLPLAPEYLRFWAITCTAGCDELGPSRRFARGTTA